MANIKFAYEVKEGAMNAINIMEQQYRVDWRDSNQKWT